MSGTSHGGHPKCQEKAGFGIIHSTSMDRFQIYPVLVSPFLFLNPDACGHSVFPVGQSLRACHPWFSFHQEWAASLLPLTSPYQQWIEAPRGRDEVLAV